MEIERICGGKTDIKYKPWWCCSFNLYTLQYSLLQYLHAFKYGRKPESAEDTHANTHHASTYVTQKRAAAWELTSVFMYVSIVVNSWLCVMNELSYRSSNAFVCFMMTGILLLEYLHAALMALQKPSLTLFSPKRTLFGLKGLTG